MSQTLRDISVKMIQRYSSRYQEHGYGIKTLGWGSEQQQHYRFSQTLLTGYDLNDKRILDIGCGFGDYYDFLKECDIEISSYLGVDINSDLINEAKHRHKDASDSDFRVMDLTDNSEKEPIADIAIMLGLLNLNLQDCMDNYEYSFNMIKNAFSLVNETLIVDFISAKRDSNYPKEDFIFYHEPNRIMEFALNIADNIVIKHDYRSIPQKEFMLILSK